MADQSSAGRALSESGSSTSIYRKPSQARGIVKFECILDAAHEMIDELGLTGLSLTGIAERAGVASGSVYHFFPSLTAIFTALVERYDEEFAELVRLPIEHGQIGSWDDIVIAQTERSRIFINDNRPAMLLMLGPGQTWQSRLIDTVGDAHIARAMVNTIGRQFVVPQHPDPVELVHNAIRCLESLWQLSFQRHGEVTEKMARETNRAMIAYLRLYWPRYLEPISGEQSPQ